MAIDKRYGLWDLILLSVLALGLRLQGLGYFCFSEREALTALAARTYLEEGEFRYPVDRNFWINLPQKWATAQMFRWVGESEWSARILPVVCGTLVTVLLFLWGAHWFGPWAGRWAAFFYAVWPASVETARSAVSDSFRQVLYFLLVVSLWKLLENNSLGRPITEPPTTASRRPGAARRIGSSIPIFVLTALALLTAPEMGLGVFFVPLYLIVRLGWIYSRKGGQDAEFPRTIRSLVLSLVLLVPAAVGLSWFHGCRFPAHGEGTYSLREGTARLWKNPVATCLAVWGPLGVVCLGAGMAVFSKRRSGWLVAVSGVGIWLIWKSLVPEEVGSAPGYVLPLLFLVSALPAAWASERLETWFHRLGVSWKAPGVREFAAMGLLAVSLFAMGLNLFVPEGRAAFQASGRGSKAADWRELTRWVSSYLEKTSVVSTDPVRCLYYAGRCDFVYPYLDATERETHGETGLRILREGRGLFGEGVSGEEGILVMGSRSRFEETLKRGGEEAREFWGFLHRQASEIWEGKEEVAFRLSRVDE